MLKMISSLSRAENTKAFKLKNIEMSGNQNEIIPVFVRIRTGILKVKQRAQRILYFDIYENLMTVLSMSWKFVM